MADTEKVKQGIKNCIANHDCYQDCPYFDDCHDLKKPMFADLAKDALSVIEELQAEIERLKEIAKNGNGFIEKCDSRAAQMFSH